MSFLHRHKDGDSGHLTAGDLGHSQYGTPLDEILHAKVGRDALKWMMVPTFWGGNWSGPDQWAETRGPEVWALWQEQTGAPKPDPEAVAPTVLELKSYAEQ